MSDMVMHYASRIEKVLSQVKYAIPDLTFIRSKPYKQIEDVLDHLDKDEPDLHDRIQNFEYAYETMRHDSLDTLLANGVNLDVMLADLEKILKRIGENKTIEMYAL